MSPKNFNFIVKIILISTLLSLIIKYGGQIVPITPSLVNVIIAVFLPSLGMGAWLWRRWRQSSL